MPIRHATNGLAGLPRLWREGRSGLELATLLRDPRFRRADPQAGGERPTLLVPVVGALGSLGAPGLFSRDCITGDCCAEVRRTLEQAFRPDVGFVSIYSRWDGIVDWRACLDPEADHVDVRASHIGMAVNADV